jgi:mannose-6-phosphate isomerase-like protein (cupin superfamily)
MSNYTFEKNLLDIKDSIDFNFIADLVSNNHFEHIITGPYMKDFVLDATYLIMNVQKDLAFKDIWKVLEERYNTNKIKSNLHIFYSFMSGGKSKSHIDEETVIIVGAYGKTMYLIDDKEFLVEPGDVLKIKKGTRHKAISLTPRIVLSYGLFE